MMASSDINYSLISAIRDGNLERVSELVHSFGLSDSQAYSLFCEALRNRHTEIAKLLLISGSKVNNKSKKPSHTPLHMAAAVGNIEIVKMLLDRGDDIDAKDEYGSTPLYSAIEYKKIEVTELLLKHGADVDAIGFFGRSPLCLAAGLGCLQIVEHLLEYRADVNNSRLDLTAIGIKTTGYTPLHYAVESGSKEIVKLLLKNNAHINTTAIHGLTPLHIAAGDRYRRQIVEDLVSHGAYINSVCTMNGYTPLHYASEQGSEEDVRLEI